MVEVYLGLGSNLGNKKANINKTINFLKEKANILKVSSLYDTEPVGYKNQDRFLNCIVKIQTRLKPEELLLFLKSIERKLKRIVTIRNGPRTIDLDIIFYGNKIIKIDNLIIPHPRLHKRLFVLGPLNELCPDFIHPILKKSVRELFLMESSDNYHENQF